MHFEHMEHKVDQAARSLPPPGEPDWVPLAALVGPALFEQFMFMGYSGEIRLYKHGMTRNYLNITPDLRTWWGKASQTGAIVYRPVPLAEALAHVFKDAEQLGGVPGQAYDAEFRAIRDQALANAGYRVTTIKPGKGVQS